MLNPVQKYIDLGNSLEPGQSVTLDLTLNVRPTRQQDLPMNQRSKAWVEDQINQGYEYIGDCEERDQELQMMLNYRGGNEEEIAINQQDLADARFQVAAHIRELRNR